MLRTRILISLALSAMLGACAPAKVKEPLSQRPSIYYLQPAQLDIQDFPPAPEPGSETDKADLSILRDWQAKRTKEQCAKAKAEKGAYFEDFYGDISPFLSPLPPEASDFFKRVRFDTDTAVSRLKDRFRRPRPFRRKEGLKKCAGKAGGRSYPSGHATISRVFALIISDLAPERRAEFLARADEAALNRVIGGVHHPSDIEAGKKAAETIYARLLENPSFRADMAALRKYLVQK